MFLESGIEGGFIRRGSDPAQQQQQEERFQTQPPKWWNYRMLAAVSSEDQFTESWVPRTPRSSQPVVFGMVANPVPDDAIFLHHSQRAILKSDANGIDVMSPSNFFELEARMSRIVAEKDDRHAWRRAEPRLVKSESNRQNFRVVRDCIKADRPTVTSRLSRLLRGLPVPCGESHRAWH